MNKNILFMGIIFALVASKPALADSGDELKNVGSCLAYAFIRADLDGKKEIPHALLPGLNALKDEFMFRASAANLSEEDAQKLVVQALVDQNAFKAEKGAVALDEEYGTLCQNIAATLMIKSE